MKRLHLPILAALALASCGAPPPDDTSRGVGFDNYDQYLAEKQARDAALARGVPAQTIVPPAQAGAQTEAQTTAQAAVAAIGGARLPDASAQLQTPAQTATAAPAAAAPQRTRTAAVSPNNTGISDEQDFEAVSARQSIQSDAERRRQQSAQYQVVQPRNLPNRPSGTAPTPIEFAVSTTHSVGQKKYSRGLGGNAKAQRACQGYSSDELAQDAFLKAGGPNRDKLGLDPDGDGFACGWSPARYRALVRN